MYEKVDTWVDLVALEHTIQDFWKQTDAFEEMRQRQVGKPVWSFLDGPITANNPMGVHHAWGRTLKDAFQRYWAMNGRRLRYQNGFDCQGLWVEVEVEKELGFKTKREIEAFGIDKFVERCKDRVRKFSAIQTEQSKRLGYWMDWNDSYYTMTDENNYTIWRFLRKCHDRNLITKGHDVMPWCPRCGTGISQHEMHEGYKDVRHLSITLRFPLRGRSNEALLVWTTTPWTLTSNVAAAVHPDLDYARVKQGDWTYYLAEARVASVCKNRGPYEVLGTVKGSELAGLSYDGPFDELPVQVKSGLAHPVVPWDLVSAEEGTGIVHIAPGCGKEDMELGQTLGLPAITPIDEAGVFIEGFGEFTGDNAQTMAPKVVDALKRKGILYVTEPYLHSYPHCWRCGEELLFRAVDEWFIRMDPWREEIKAVARQIKWIPSYGLDLELDWLGNMRDWMISKKRYWGLALPIWTCSCGHFEVIGGPDELKERAVEGYEVFDGHSPHRPFIDAVKIRCPKCDKLMSRIPDVGNPWLDAGIVPYSTVRYTNDRDFWAAWIPADLVLECFPGQFRNWFYSLLAMSTMMENIPPFKTLVGHALVRDEKGEEMHKSKGNAIWFDDAVEQMGADIMRWLYSRHENTINLNFGFGPAREVRGKFFNTLWNSYAFFANYARLDGFVPPETPSPVEGRTDFDRWILSNLMLTIRKVRRAFESYETRAACRAIEDFTEDLSNGYIRRNRRRFWKSDDPVSTKRAYETLYTCLDALVRMVAPIMPHTAEAMYQNLVRSHAADAPRSVHHADFPVVEEGWIDEGLSAAMSGVQKLTRLALAARENAKVKVRQPLARLVVAPADGAEEAALNRFADLLREDLNVKAVEVRAPGSPSPLTVEVKPNFKTLGRKVGGLMKGVQAAVAERASSLAEEWKNGAETFALAVGPETVTLAREDLLVETRSEEGWSVVEEKGSWAGLDTTMTDDLRDEGRMRELLRRLQVQRKEVGLEIEDRIHVLYQTGSERIARIVETFKEDLKAELLALSFDPGEAGAGTEHVLDGESVRVLVTKA